MLLFLSRRLPVVLVVVIAFVLSTLLFLVSTTCAENTQQQQQQQQQQRQQEYDDGRRLILVKIGGSSITNKAQRETLRPEALTWLSETIVSVVGMVMEDGNSRDETIKRNNETCTSSNPNMVLVHGAGSFGHHTAKEYGLTGQSSQEPADKNNNNKKNYNTTTTLMHRRRLMQGVSKTRLSVQTLNRHVVSSLMDHGVPAAVGISPLLWCSAHAGTSWWDKRHGSSRHRGAGDTLQAGILPVIHGDACLHGRDGAGILGGDTIMKELCRRLSFSRAVFVTDVDGVFTADPRTHPNATLLETIQVDDVTGQILTKVSASGSSHGHDVTGGLATKLSAAASMAMSGTEVVIAKCESKGAERAIQGHKDFGVGTLIQGVSTLKSDVQDSE